MEKRKFVIDCDTGTDDAIAIVAAMGCEEIDILAITSCNGNVPEKFVAQNNLDLVAYMGKDIPVYHGAFLPLLADRNANADASIHGKTGLGDVELPHTDKKCAEGLGPTVMYELAKKYPGELEILVTGPMTNLAIAVLEHPDFISLVKHVYFMGGATIGGNVNSTAEFNIWCDPEACHRVLTSGLPLTMVGINVSNLAIMWDEDEQAIRASGKKGAVLVADLLKYMINRKGQDIHGARMHDPLSLAAALCPECLVFEDLVADCECTGTFTRGHTAIDIFHKSKETPNVSVAVEVKVDIFREWLIKKVCAAGD